MNNFSLCRMKLWDFKYLGRVRKAMPLPLGLTVSDLFTYWQMKTPKRKTHPDHELTQQFVMEKLLLSSESKSLIIYFLLFSLQMTYLMPSSCWQQERIVSKIKNELFFSVSSPSSTLSLLKSDVKG